MELQLIPFRARHVTCIVPQVSDEMMRLAEFGERFGRGLTGCILGDPVGCGGIICAGPDTVDRTGQAWALFSPVIKTIPLALFRAVKREIRTVAAELKLARAYCLVEPHDETAARFVKHLGFSLNKHLYQWEVR